MWPLWAPCPICATWTVAGACGAWNGWFDGAGHSPPSVLTQKLSPDAMKLSIGQHQRGPTAGLGAVGSDKASLQEEQELGGGGPCGAEPARPACAPWDVRKLGGRRGGAPCTLRGTTRPLRGRAIPDGGFRTGPHCARGQAHFLGCKTSLVGCWSQSEGTLGSPGG